MLGRHEGVAWLAGGFMFIGFIVHLVLDEIYSVDVMDTRIKASFGTALKLWDGKHLGHSAMMAAAAAALFLVAPPSKTFIDGVTSPALWAGLKQQLLPQEKWFGMFGDMTALRFGKSAGPAADATPTAPKSGDGAASSNVTTGALPLPPAQPASEPPKQ
jgi:hypothetical protein